MTRRARRQANSAHIARGCDLGMHGARYRRHLIPKVSHSGGLHALIPRHLNLQLHPLRARGVVGRD